MKIVSVLLDSSFHRGAAGVCGAGQRLATALNASFEVILPSSMPSEDQQQVASIADSVLLLDEIDRSVQSPEKILAVLEAALSKDPPDGIVFGNGVYPQEIAPRLAFRLEGACVGDVQGVSVREGKVCLTRAVYGGKATAVLSIQKQPAVIWVRAAAMDPAESRDGEGTISSLSPADVRESVTELIERHHEVVEGVRLEDASVIVSGGRGLGGAEPFERLKALAKPMKAEMAASRAACDLGWVPHSWQVGQTGKKVAPELYLAIAMSGSSQHLMGIADAKNIVAINTDPEAPIFRHCRFGIVEDYDKVVDLLRDKLAEKLK
jgi:electron transfer flavoprotein alpha subunit